MKNDIIARLEKKVAENPESVAGYLELSQVLCATDDIERGLELLHKALELEPGNLGVLFMLGAAYEKLGMYDRAISTWEAKILAGGDKVTCYIFMIRCCCKKGDKETALRIQHLLRDINEDQAERVSSVIALTQ